MVTSSVVLVWQKHGFLEGLFYSNNAGAGGAENGQ